MKTLRLAVIIPAYNEAKAIEQVIGGVSKALKTKPYDTEIIVIDDGSTDDTAKKAKLAGATVISHILNTGTGGTTATGISYANQENFDIAATLDADGQHDPSDLIRGIDLLVKNGDDLVIGSRLIKPVGMSSVKIIGNKGLSFITFLLFGINVTDSQSGLRVFSKKALSGLKWKTSGFEFCSEMLWRARQQKLRITEYPIKAIYTDYSKSKGQNNWNGLNIVKSLLKRRIMEIFGE